MSISPSRLRSSCTREQTTKIGQNWMVAGFCTRIPLWWCNYQILACRWCCHSLLSRRDGSSTIACAPLDIYSKTLANQRSNLWKCKSFHRKLFTACLESLQCAAGWYSFKKSQEGVAGRHEQNSLKSHMWRELTGQAIKISILIPICFFLIQAMICGMLQ